MVCKHNIDGDLGPGCPDCDKDLIKALLKDKETLTRERDEARNWVQRLTNEERVLTCVYCGHAYPPGSPSHGSEVLTEHIKTCPRHPMTAVRNQLKGAVRLMRRVNSTVLEHSSEQTWCEWTAFLDRFPEEGQNEM